MGAGAVFSLFFFLLSDYEIWERTWKYVGTLLRHENVTVRFLTIENDIHHRMKIICGLVRHLYCLIFGAMSTS